MATTLDTLDIERVGQGQGISGGFLQGVGRAAARNPVGAVAGVLCLILIFLAIFGPTLAPYSATRVDFPRLEAPSSAHPFGTDNLLRDIFSRILIGTRNSLGIAFASIALSTVLGVVLGIGSGYLAGA